MGCLGFMYLPPHTPRESAHMPICIHTHMHTYMPDRRYDFLTRFEGLTSERITSLHEYKAYPTGE